MAVVGNGSSYSVQMDAGIENADLFIAVTGSDELNLLCCTIAKHEGDCATVARVRTPDYSKEATYLRDKLGLIMIINPELEAAIEMYRILSLPQALDVISFAHGHVDLIKYKIIKDDFFDGLTMIEIGKKRENAILVAAVERDGVLYIPSGEFKMQEGDMISIVAPRRTARPFLQKIGFKTRQLKNTMIVGGGRAAYYLAKQLIDSGIEVKIIEEKKERCEELSTLLPEATIIQGNGSDQEILTEEGLEYAESFVPLTGIDEENVMLTLYARDKSKAKVITKITRTKLKKVIGSLDLGSVIYPQYIASDATGKALKEISLKRDLLVACIDRKGKVFVPTGNDVIKKGDSVMVVAKQIGLSTITDILA